MAALEYGKQLLDDIKAFVPKGTGAQIAGAGILSAFPGFSGLKDMLFSAGSTALNNLVNEFFARRTAKYNFDLSEQSAENQYNRQLDFWDRENEYNSPQNQVSRRFAAGLSPTDQVDSGNSQGLETVPGNNVGLNGALNFSPSFDLLGSLRTVNEITNMGKTGNVLDAQVANLFADEYLKSLEGLLRKNGLDEAAERLKGIRLDNVRKEKENKYQYTDDWYKSQFDLVQQTLNKLNSDAFVASKDADFYKKIGIHPSRLGGPKERMILSALNSILNILGVDPKTVFDKKDSIFLDF